jgi:hypothetical protein
MLRNSLIWPVEYKYLSFFHVSLIKVKIPGNKLESPEGGGVEVYT